MISINKAYFWILLWMTFALVISPKMVTFADEFGALLMLVVMFLDIVLNRQWARYKCVYLLFGIMAFYAAYSMYAVHYNNTRAIALDWLLEQKPFLPFFFTMAIKPRLTEAQKSVIRAVCVVLTVVLILIFLSGTTLKLLHHVMYIGSSCYMMALICAVCSVNPRTNTIPQKHLILCIFILCVGLLSTRSKYYGEFVLALAMLIFYKPSMFKGFKPIYLVAMLLVAGAVVLVAWTKIEYYFFNTEFLNSEERVQNFARPALYYGAFCLLLIHPIFGSGLASFASFASTTSVNYSLAYAKVGLDKVWGLSPTFDDFICDAFYPTLAQFGIVGIVLIVWLYVWIVRKTRVLRDNNGSKLYAVGLLCVCYIAIQNVAATSLMQSDGMYSMMILGLIAGESLRKEQENKTKETI